MPSSSVIMVVASLKKIYPACLSLILLPSEMAWGLAWPAHSILFKVIRVV
jgi:hypothetical protein